MIVGQQGNTGRASTSLQPAIPVHAWLLPERVQLRATSFLWRLDTTLQIEQSVPTPEVYLCYDGPRVPIANRNPVTANFEYASVIR